MRESEILKCSHLPPSLHRTHINKSQEDEVEQHLKSHYFDFIMSHRMAECDLTINLTCQIVTRTYERVSSMKIAFVSGKIEKFIKILLFILIQTFINTDSLLPIPTL